MPASRLTAPATAVLATSSRPRIGTACRVVRMLPEAYSAVIISIARAISANWATYTVATATSPTGTRAPFLLLFAMVAPRIGVVSSISPAPPSRHHQVDLTNQSLIHSAATAPGSPPPEPRTAGPAVVAGIDVVMTVPCAVSTVRRGRVEFCRRLRAGCC